MRRRARRSAVPSSFARSWPMNRISPAVGSTSRLMQRTSVDLPAPDGPITAVMPRPSSASDTFLSTIELVRYCLLRLRMTSERSGAGSVELCPRFRASASIKRGSRFWRLLRRGGVPLLFGERLGFALRLRLVARLVVRGPGLLRDVAHHRPGLLVGDRHEPIIAVELLGHFRPG